MGTPTIPEQLAAMGLYVAHPNDAGRYVLVDDDGPVRVWATDEPPAVVLPASLAFCAICDRDRDPGAAGEERGDDWICAECLATEPSDERIPCPVCHGAGTCMLCDDAGMVPA